MYFIKNPLSVLLTAIILLTACTKADESKWKLFVQNGTQYRLIVNEVSIASNARAQVGEMTNAESIELKFSYEINGTVLTGQTYLATAKAKPANEGDELTVSVIFQNPNMMTSSVVNSNSPALEVQIK